MAEIYLISDTHFGHANILTFEANGKKMREFASVEEMDEFMVQRWNSVVRPQDKVYHLGDFAMHKRNIPIAQRLNGHKRLVLGNHDDEDVSLYLPYFEKVLAFRKLSNVILTHIPLHPESLRKDWANVHGHVHSNVPQGHFGQRYYNVSVEMIDYTPVPLHVVRDRIQKMQDDNMALAAGQM